MRDMLINFFVTIGIQDYAQPATYAVFLIILTIICFISRYVVKLLLVSIGTKIAIKTNSNWLNVIVKNKFLHKLSFLTIPVAVRIFENIVNMYPTTTIIIENISVVITLMPLINSFINSVDEIYRSYEISNIKPIKSILQVIKILLYIISLIIIIAMFLGENPSVIIGSIGAMTAVTGLILKDPILGFIAGIQLTHNDQIRIGDWIEVPKYSANGIVAELTMTTVKVQNFDMTITSIPAYTLVSDSFINWRGMQSAGGRRIKRRFYLDVNKIRICSDEMIEKFQKYELLKNYMQSKLSEISEHNLKNNLDLSEKINGRRLTNVGTFRAYILEYLKNHPCIRDDMAVMVRQLEPGDVGLPIEVYAFTNTIKWVDYENIQSDIFDHIYSVAEEFGLNIYQKPSSLDRKNEK